MRYCLTVILLFAPATTAELYGQYSEREEIEIVKPKATNPTTIGKADVSRVEKTIIDRTNSIRQQNSVDVVKRDENLDKAAEYFATYMAKNDKYGHTADGNMPAQRAKKFNYDYCIVLENIAYQYRTQDFATQKLAGRFLTGWKNSPGHRKNMLDPDVTETGVAVVQSKDSGYYYAVQMFGRPKSEDIEFSLLNKSSTTVEYKIGKRKYSLPPRYERTHTVCRPPELTLSTSTGENSVSRQKVEPRDGSRYVVQPSGQGLRVKKN